MNIALAFNVRHVKPSLKNPRALKEAEFDEPETIEGISKALKKLGFGVFLVEADEKAYFKFKKLKPRINLVFNIAEGIYGADREAQIPAILEMLQIPYLGSKPLTQAICLNKTLTKEILSRHGIPTPDCQLFKTDREKLRKNLEFPLIVKPNNEGSSKGIFQKSFVRNEKELKKRISEIIKKFDQPALAEKFLTGKEFTVSLIGNDPCVEILPPAEFNFSVLPEHFIPMDSYEVKWLLDNPKSKIETVTCPARITEDLRKQITEICLKTKEALEVLDWCRIDLRLDEKGIPNILEINQIPGIIPDPKENSRFPLAARAAGYSYEEMLNKIIKTACKRCKIQC